MKLSFVQYIGFNVQHIKYTSTCTFHAKGSTKVNHVYIRQRTRVHDLLYISQWLTWSNLPIPTSLIWLPWSNPPPLCHRYLYEGQSESSAPSPN